MRQLEGYSQYHIQQNTRLAKEALEIYMKEAQKGHVPELYCFYTVRLKMLHVSNEKPQEDSKLAFPEKIPNDLTLEQLNYWFAVRTESVPYLGD